MLNLTNSRHFTSGLSSWKWILHLQIGGAILATLPWTTIQVGRLRYSLKSIIFHRPR